MTGAGFSIPNHISAWSLLNTIRPDCRPRCPQTPPSIAQPCTVAVNAPSRQGLSGKLIQERFWLGQVPTPHAVSVLRCSWRWACTGVPPASLGDGQRDQGGETSPGFDCAQRRLWVCALYVVFCPGRLQESFLWVNGAKSLLCGSRGPCRAGEQSCVHGCIPLHWTRPCRKSWQG